MARRNRIPLERLFSAPDMCGQKRRYVSQREAETVREQQELLNPGLSLSVYKCIQPGCGGWHLTRNNHDVV